MPSPLYVLPLRLTDAGRDQLDALAQHYAAATGLAVTRTEAVRLALNDAAKVHGLPAVPPPPRGGRKPRDGVS